MGFNYNEFISRNWAFIDKDLQDEIFNSRIVLAGCGLSSYIAELAVRIGFTDFCLIDGDQVEVSNLNRQAFNYRESRLEKTKVLKNHLKKINPSITVDLINKYISDSNINDLIYSCDFLVNTTNISEVYFQLTKAYANKGIPVILPFNVAFGGLVIFIPPDCRQLESFLDLYSSAKDDLLLLMMIARTSKNFAIPSYISDNLSNIAEGMKERGYNPQVGIGSFVTASLVNNLMIGYKKHTLSNKQIQFFFLDLPTFMAKGHKLLS